MTVHTTPLVLALVASASLVAVAAPADAKGGDVVRARRVRRLHPLEAQGEGGGRPARGRGRDRQQPGRPHLDLADRAQRRGVRPGHRHHEGAERLVHGARAAGQPAAAPTRSRSARATPAPARCVAEPSASEPVRRHTDPTAASAGGATNATRRAVRRYLTNPVVQFLAAGFVAARRRGAGQRAAEPAGGRRGGDRRRPGDHGAARPLGRGAGAAPRAGRRGRRARWTASTGRSWTGCSWAT